MTDIFLSNENIQYINMTSKITKASILDCVITEEKLVFIVSQGQVWIALGAKAKNLEKLRNMFKKSIKFIEYSDDKEKFIANLCKPYKVKKIELDGEDENTIARIEVEIGDKSKIIGKGGKNIEIIRQLAQRHHNFKDVQIK